MKMLTEEELLNASDEEILDAYDAARSHMSYFNAAEGSAWRAEAKDRANAAQYLSLVNTELNNRNLEGRPGNYLC